MCSADVMTSDCSAKMHMSAALGAEEEDYDIAEDDRHINLETVIGEDPWSSDWSCLNARSAVEDGSACLS